MYDAWKNEKVDLSGVGISAGSSRQRQAEGHGMSESDPVWLLTMSRIESGSQVTHKPHQDLNLLQ
jgi:hypothetical protein